MEEKLLLWLKETYNLWITGRQGVRPSITCKDGYNVSIQAGWGWYCSPREDLKNGNYKSVELGFPNKIDDELIPYAEDKDNLSHTVYGYVPIEIIAKVLEKHGGF